MVSLAKAERPPQPDHPWDPAKARHHVVKTQDDPREAAPHEEDPRLADDFPQADPVVAAPAPRGRGLC